jgi:hypothetical protein
MDSVRLALCGALATVAVCAAPAYAADGPATRSGTIELTPVTGHPGDQVRLRVAGCADGRATARSEALVSDARPAKDSAGLVAAATVRSVLAPGTYAVKVDCDGHDTEARGRLAVVEARPARPEQVQPDGRGGDRADGVARSAQGEPTAPVPAGGGGTATAPGTPGLILGGGTALIAAGLIWHRRRTEAGRRTAESDR